jgi:hypothetical protein
VRRAAGPGAHVDRLGRIWRPPPGLLAWALVLAACLAAPNASLGDAGAQRPLATAPVLQAAAGLVASEGSVASQFGSSVSLASDGRTALVGAPGDSGGRGAAWVFVKTEAGWTQQGAKLAPDEALESAQAGSAVALSGDGNVAIVGAIGYDGGRGAAWIFTRSGGTWTQSGPRLEPSDAESEPHNVLFGASVALSANGSTALVGGYGDQFGGYGGAWVFVRSGDTWVQQGPRLAPASEQLGADGYYAWFGFSVALSADGNTALVGGEHDEERTGAAWVFVRSGNEWSQQGPKLLSGALGPQLFGDSVSLSADGDTALIGGEETGGDAGAVWTFTRVGASWVPEEALLTPTDFGTEDHFGHSVAIDPSGTSAIVGAPAYNFGQGFAWTYSRAGPGWSAPATPLTPGFASEGGESYGSSVAAASNGGTVLVGAPAAGQASGTAWVFGSDPGMRKFVRINAYGSAASPPQSGIDAQAQFDGEVTGTVTWKWYGPDATSCSGPPLGTAMSAVQVEAGFSASSAILPTTNEVGSYLLVASYSGDSRTAPSASGCGAIVVEVKAWPTLLTTVEPVAHVGSPIHIVPILQGGLEPAGAVEVLVFDTSGCAGLPVANQTVEVRADETAPAIEFVPVTPGKLFIYAYYSGDAKNFGISTVACDDEHAVVVDQAEPTVEVTAASPRIVGESISTAARLRGGYAPSGLVKFVLFPPADPTCAGSPTATVSVPLSASGDASSGPFATTTTGVYHFLAEYTGDANNRAYSTACSSASVEVARRRAVLGVSGAADVAGYGTLEGTASLRDGFLPAGNVKLSLFRTDQNCHGHPLLFVRTALNDGVAKTGALGPVPAGSYTFAASYDGDQNNEPLSSVCGGASAVVPAILQRASLTSAGVRVVLRCAGVAVARCAGTITATLHSRVLIRSHYRLLKGKTTTRVLEFGASGAKALRSRRYRYLALIVQLEESGQSQTIQHLRMRLRPR